MRRYLGSGVCPAKGAYCIDTCSAPGYQCAMGVNVAKNVRMVASTIYTSSYGPRKVDYATDDDKDTFWAPKDGPNPWLLIDLGERRLVAYLLWEQLKPKHKKFWDYMKPMGVRIGDHDESNVNENPVCVEGVDHSNHIRLVYYCTHGPMYGRYVVLFKGDTPKKERFYVSIIQIFVLD